MVVLFAMHDPNPFLCHGTVVFPNIGIAVEEPPSDLGYSYEIVDDFVITFLLRDRSGVDEYRKVEYKPSEYNWQQLIKPNLLGVSPPEDS
jgi:hypothetical protein